MLSYPVFLGGMFLKEFVERITMNRDDAAGRLVSARYSLTALAHVSERGKSFSFPVLISKIRIRFWRYTLLTFSCNKSEIRKPELIPKTKSNQSRRFCAFSTFFMASSFFLSRMGSTVLKTYRLVHLQISLALNL